MREFDSGATRDTDENKLDFEGFLSPLVLQRYAEYLNKHRTQADGKLRDSDNWQKGIPLKVYIKSAFRHFFGWWANHRHVVVKENIEESLCGLLFNAMGYLHEHLKDKAGEYNAAEIDGPEPKFKAGDKVKIMLRGGYEACEALRIMCASVSNEGIYITRTEDRYIVDISNDADDYRIFYLDEIFPVEDN